MSTSQFNRLDILPIDSLQIRGVKPTATDTSGAPEPDNSEIRKITNDLLQAAQYSFASVAANPDQSFRANTLEETFQQGFKGMNAVKVQGIKTKAVQLVKAAPELRTIMFGRYGRLASEEFTKVGFDAVQEKLAPLEIDRKLLGIRTPELCISPSAGVITSEGLLIPAANLPPGVKDLQATIDKSVRSAAASEVHNADKLEEIWGPVYATDPFAGVGGDEFVEQAITNKLGFYITRIKCVDETNPEWWFSDEIAIGGISVDDNGDSKKIPEKYVGGGFDDGDEKKYSPHWLYHSFNLQEGKYFPKRESVGVTLSEEDGGGFSKFLNTIWEKVSAKVKEAIIKILITTLPKYVDAAIAAAVAKAVAWLVDKLVGWIINWFKDDIFPVFTASCTIPSLNARWNYPNGTWGSTTSDLRTAHFYGHGGHYLVNYYWKLYA